MRFVEKYAPGRFYNETEDYAKPAHLPVSLKDWEKIEEKDLESVLKKVYEARSQLIHNGIRLPESIVIGHFRRVKAELMGELTERVIYKGEFGLQIPPLLTFERLVSYSLVEFLRKYENAGV